MKKFFLYFIQIILIISLIYIISIDNIPNNIILFENEEIKLNTLFGISIKDYETEQVATSLGKSISEEKNPVKLQLSLFDKIPLKKVNINVIPKTNVVVLGNTIGLKLYTNGVMVVGMSEVEGRNNKKVKPYKESGIEEGDVIISVNQKEVTCTTDLIENINKCNGEEVEIKYIRDGEIYTSKIQPIKTEQNYYKIGFWVRDSAAGVGTISFYEPKTGMFAALGHGLTDIDTGELITIANGNIVTTNVVAMTKGEKGKPGEMKGTLTSQSDIGDISKNTRFGIFGKLNNISLLNINNEDALEVANRDEITEGKAKIICTLNDNKRQEYEIEIQKIFKNNNEDNKSMIIKVTDNDLLDKTGGIIQGMSGSPIVQNNKVIGAVTHVFVTDPTMGYAIFADLMIKQMREVE